MLVDKLSASSWMKKGSATMLATKKSAGVTPEVNQESIAHRRQSMPVRDPFWLWNPGNMSPEVQNRGISGHTLKKLVLPNFLN